MNTRISLLRPDADELARCARGLRWLAWGLALTYIVSPLFFLIFSTFIIPQTIRGPGQTPDLLISLMGLIGGTVYLAGYLIQGVGIRGLAMWTKRGNLLLIVLAVLVIAIPLRVFLIRYVGGNSLGMALLLVNNVIALIYDICLLIVLLDFLRHLNGFSLRKYLLLRGIFFIGVKSLILLRNVTFLLHVYWLGSLHFIHYALIVITGFYITALISISRACQRTAQQPEIRPEPPQ